MNLLEQQIQLLRNFVTEINHAESLANTGPIWRGLSNVFTDLSGMFGSGSGGRGSGGQYVSIDLNEKYA